MVKEFKTNGVCSSEIYFEIINNKLHNVSFIGGCSGNLKAISKLVEGKQKDEVVELLKGIKCGNRNTSCADQLVEAIENNNS